MSQESLTAIARYDELTGLPNRVFFNEILSKSLSSAKRRQSISAVLMVSLDRGEGAGQNLSKEGECLLLKEMARRFSSVLRTEDVLAKLEGQEYILLLNDIDKPKFASVVAEKLLKVCMDPIEVDSGSLGVTVNIGIATFPQDGDNLQDVLNNASAALFRAKQSGEGVYQFHTPKMNTEAREFVQLRTDLAQAIQHKEIILHFQPKLHVASGKVVSAEALIRWAHPKLGLLMPDKFIAVAEETGLILSIGEWTLKEACRLNKAWQTEGYGHVILSVNLSAKQFYHPGIERVIDTALKEAGLQPSYLEIEINESTVMDNIDAATEILEKIKALGINITLDHFGVGFTSISHLKKFPLRYLKIDPSYIKGTPFIPNDTAITDAFIVLAHRLGLKVIAEGVETAEQVEYLANQHCDLIQGYFLSPPVSADAILLHFDRLQEQVLF